MIICIIMVAVCLFVYSRSIEGIKRRLRRIIALIPVLLIFLRLIYVICAGAAVIYELPLHLCSIAGMVCFIYEYTGNSLPSGIRATLSQALLSLCLPGALMALIFTDGTVYPVIHFITIQSTLFHVFIVIYIIITIKDHDVYPSVKEAYRNIIFLLCIVPFVYIFDKLFKANYMFLMNPSKGSPLSWAYTHGRFFYLFIYGFIVIIVIYLINLIGEYILRYKNQQ